MRAFVGRAANVNMTAVASNKDNRQAESKISRNAIRNNEFDHIRPFNIKN